MDDLAPAWIQLEVLGPLRSEPRRCLRPLASDSVAAGFPSPADDYIETGIDLNEALIRHPSSTFFLRVSGDSMRGAGIQHGDLLIVDRSLEFRSGKICCGRDRRRLHPETAGAAPGPMAPGSGPSRLSSHPPQRRPGPLPLGGSEPRHPCPLRTRGPAQPAAGPPC